LGLVVMGNTVEEVDSPMSHQQAYRELAPSFGSDGLQAGGASPSSGGASEMMLRRLMIRRGSHLKPIGG
jgi:hypothetical protein